MARLRIGGQVFGLNSKPIKNAKVVIVDQDLGSSNDTIYSGRTDSEGIFRGTSRDWQDDNWIQGPFGTRIPTPDILSLSFKVTKDNNKHSGLFVLLANGTSAPIIVPWNDPEVFAIVDGNDCFSASEAAQAIRNAAQNQNSITIHILDPIVQAELEPITRSANSLRQFIRENNPALMYINNLNFTRRTYNPGLTYAVDPVSIGVGVSLILLAIAVIISMAGVSVATVLIAMAIRDAIGECDTVTSTMHNPNSNSNPMQGQINIGGGSLQIDFSGCANSNS